jgi:hypothetical protein
MLRSSGAKKIRAPGVLILNLAPSQIRLVLRQSPQQNMRQDPYFAELLITQSE